MLVSAAAELRRQNSLQAARARHELLEDFSTKAAASLGDKFANEAIEDGTKMTLREAVELALKQDDQAASS